MKKKVIDIFPPKRLHENLSPELRNEPDRAPSKERARRIPKKTLAFLMLFFGGVIVLQFGFAQTNVSIWPQTRELHIAETIYAKLQQETSDPEKRIIPGRVVEQEKEATKLFSSSGRKFKEGKAEGIIRVYNEHSTSPQTFVANTRFISEGGKLFRSKEKATIPGGYYDEKGKFVAESLDVQVVAAEPGESYNIGTSNFSLPGLAGSALYTKIYGKSFQDMKGGAQKEVAVVTKEDLSGARDGLVESLTAQALESLRSKIPPSQLLVEKSIQSEVLTDRSLIKEGAELDQFNYVAKVKVSAFVFEKGDAELLAKHILKEHLQETEQLEKESVNIVYEGGERDQDSDTLAIETNIFAKSYHEIDARSLAEGLQGISKGQAANILSAYPYLARAELSLWPFWVNTLPKDPERVNVELSM